MLIIKFSITINSIVAMRYLIQTKRVGRSFLALLQPKCTRYSGHMKQFALQFHLRGTALQII